MDNKAGSIKETARQQPFTSLSAPSASCSQCGAVARRAEARFCLACGRSLHESYLPADALRASYNQQPRRSISRSRNRTNSSKHLQSSMSSISPVQNTNGASTTALAFVTYALVPYLGILFCPGAVLMGSVGLYRSYRRPERGGRRASFFGVAFGLLIFGAQILLWWILYKIPQWAGKL